MPSTKNIVYILTYWAYAMNHACRMTLAYNKPNIKTAFGLTAVDLGIIDALVYIAYGIGTFFRFYFFGQQYLTRLYLISALCISSFFASMPFVSLFAEDQIRYRLQNDESILYFKLIIVVSMIGYGFSHLATWQIILSLMSKYWNIKSQGQYMGFWTSMSCIGNIMAFLVSNFMITSLELRWQVTMLFFAIMNLFAALFMYFLIDQSTFQQSKNKLNQQNNLNNTESNQLSLEMQDQNQKDITTREFIEFNKNKFFATLDFKLFVCTSTCQKILSYSFLFWYPTFLYVQGFDKIGGYITMLFDIASIFGSFMVGKMMMYDKATCRRCGVEQSESNKFLKVMNILLKLKNVLIMMFSVAMTFLFLEKFGSLMANVLITILLGLTIGGILHVNATFNSFTLGEHIPRNVDMVSTFSTALGTVMLGVVQLIIGLIVNIQIPPHATERQVRKLKSWSYRNLFKFLLVLMIISTILMFFRSGVLKLLCPPKLQQAKPEAVKQKQQPVQKTIEYTALTQDQQEHKYKTPQRIQV